MKLWCPVTRTITFAFSITELSANKKDISAGLSFSPFNFTRRESASTSRCYCLSILDSDSPSFLRLRERERERERERGEEKKMTRKREVETSNGRWIKGKDLKTVPSTIVSFRGNRIPGCLPGRLLGSLRLLLSGRWDRRSLEQRRRRNEFGFNQVLRLKLAGTDFTMDPHRLDN